MVGPLASSTHETRLLIESGEQGQRSENEPRVQTAAADAHGLCREQISFESLSATTHWTKSPTSVAKDSPKRPGTKGITFPSQILGQSRSLTSIEQDRKHQGPEDFHPPAQASAAPHPMIQ